MWFTNPMRRQNTKSSGKRILLTSLLAIAIDCLATIDVQAVPMTNLQVWLQADAIEGLSDGDEVATWLDQSGRSNDATQTSSGNRPTYSTSALNGLPTVSFDGLNDYLQIDSNAGLEPQTLSAFAVVVATAEGGSSDGRDLFGKYYGPSNPYASYGLELRSSSTSPNAWRIHGSYGGSYTGVRTSAVEINQPDVLSGVWNPDNVKLFVDGDERANRDATGSFAYNGEPLAIGTWLADVGEAHSYGGHLAEFLLYDAALSIDDRQLVEGSLAWKYGLQDQLPASHPYRSMSPEISTADFNNDGGVDGGDFLAWQRDPTIGNLADWEANFGATMTSHSAHSASHAPEPASVSLLAIGLAVLLSRRRPK